MWLYSLVCMGPGFFAHTKTKTQISFRYIDSTIPLLPIYEISSLLERSCVVVQPGLYGTWAETPKAGFLTTRLKLYQYGMFLCQII